MTEATRSPAIGQAEFDQRFALVQDRLLRICIGLVGRERARDVVHDVYLRARSRQRQLHDPDRFDAWICRAAVNLCFNHQRQRRRLLAALPLLAERPQHRPPPDVGLRELIEQLPPRERTLVILHYGYGYQLGEIAELLHMTPVNARTVLSRARQRLGEELREAER